MVDLQARKEMAEFADDPDAFNDLWNRGHETAAACSLLPNLMRFMEADASRFGENWDVLLIDRLICGDGAMVCEMVLSAIRKLKEAKNG